LTSLANTVSKKAVGGSEGCVAYDGRESLTFNGVPGNVVDLQGHRGPKVLFDRLLSE